MCLIQVMNQYLRPRVRVPDKYLRPRVRVPDHFDVCQGPKPPLVVRLDVQRQGAFQVETKKDELFDTPSNKNRVSGDNICERLNIDARGK